MHIIRVVHGWHFWTIFGSFSASFLDHFRVFGRRMIRMDRKMMWKMERKMATVNVPKRKHFKNEAKMHFTYLRQCSAHSNSTSKDLTRLFAWVHHLQAPFRVQACIYKLLSMLRCEQWGLYSRYIYSFVLLTNKTKKEKRPWLCGKRSVLTLWWGGLIIILPSPPCPRCFVVPIVSSVIASSPSFRHPHFPVVPVVSSSLVFRSPVQSGFLTYFWIDRTLDRLPNKEMIEKTGPDHGKTAKNRSKPV
jgi:hypothetical protein